MALQARIHGEHQAARVGTTVEVLIDGREGDVAVGRTAADAPEVDAVVRVEDPGGRLATGDLATVIVTAADGYDLRATPDIAGHAHQ